MSYSIFYDCFRHRIFPLSGCFIKVEMTTNHSITKKKHYLTAISVAGLDPSGGAGILADVKTFSALGVYGAAVATALTVQNTTGVKAVHAVAPEVVYDQIVAVVDDLRPDAMKIGMVNDAATIDAIAAALEKHPPRWLVVDPVLVSSSGKALMQPDAIEAFRERLMPRATLLTPNIPEACRLAALCFDSERWQEQIVRAARTLLAGGASAVLIKGGHADGDRKTDVLFSMDGERITQKSFSAPTVSTDNTHGTGCTLSAAIAAFLARGASVEESVRSAKQYLTEAMIEGADVKTGCGTGAVNHFFNPEKLIKQ